MMARIELERGVPGPPGNGGGRPAKYPFRHMQPGDSFLISGKEARRRIAAAAANYGRRPEGYVFTIKGVVGNRRQWRIWRV
jgi:hypothetical protein